MLNNSSICIVNTYKNKIVFGFVTDYCYIRSWMVFLKSTNNDIKTQQTNQFKKCIGNPFVMNDLKKKNLYVDIICDN